MNETITNIDNLSFGNKRKLYIIKIGGNIIDDAQKLSSFLKEFAAVEGEKILVHGGGKLATKLAAQLGIKQQIIEGRRVTDAQTLKIVTMVYAGYINKNMVAQLQALNCNAIGLCGADGNIIQAHKRLPENEGGIDYGFVGDVDAVNISLLKTLLYQNLTIVLAPITQNKEGQLLNINADTIAQETAKALSALYEVHLIYLFEKSGVLLDSNDDKTVIPILDWIYYQQLKLPCKDTGQPKIFAGMIPKLDNAFAALTSGVKRVVIGKAEELHQLISGNSGTGIIASPALTDERP